MGIMDKITELETSIQKTDLLVDEIILYLEEQKTKIRLKEERILKLKEEITVNVEKIDEIVENYNGNN
jgi:hypothetical protein